MPIDPRIPLMYQPPRIPTAQDWEDQQYSRDQRKLTLASLADQQKMHAMQLSSGQLELSEKQRQLQAAERIRGILAQTPNLEQALPAIMGVDPQIGMAFAKQIQEQRKTKLDVTKTQNEVNTQQVEMIGRLAGAVKAAPADAKAQAWANALSTAQSMGMDISGIPQEYNPQVVDQVFAWALDAKAQEQSRQWSTTDARAAEQWQVKKPGEVAASEVAQLGAAAQTVAPVSNQAQYDSWRSTLPPAVQSRIPAMFSPSAVQLVQRMGMGAAEQVSAADRQTSLAEASRHNTVTERQTGTGQAETRRHNVVMEGVLAGGGQAARAPMSGDQAKVYSISTTIIPDLESIKTKFGITKNPDGTPKVDNVKYKNALRSYLMGTDRDLVKLIDSAADKVGRLRSGGAINKDEESRFIRALGSWGDLVFGDAMGALQAIDRYASEAQSVSQSMTTPRNQLTGPGGTLPITPGGATHQITVTLPNGQTFQFQTQAAADAFRREAGLTQ